jgi:hypothetical protein
MRPWTLAEVAQFTVSGESFDLCIANFLDEFYAAPNAARLSTEPNLLAPVLADPGRVQDAYLAAVAEHLAYTHGFPIPSWVGDKNRKLHRPWFASQLAGLRAVLILESPAAFRARNLFVSENALSRA